MDDRYLSVFSRSVESVKNQIDNIWNVIYSAPPGPALNKDNADVVPYELPDETSLDMPLNPVAKFSLQESGKYGPLKEHELLVFLSHKFDRRLKRTLDILQTFSQDIEGVKDQLGRLRNRIEEIEAAELRRSDFLHKNVRRILTTISYIGELDAETVGSIPGYQSPDAAKFEEYLTSASKLALRDSAKNGPLDEQKLKMLLCDRLDSGWRNNLIIIWKYTKDVRRLYEQLEDLRNRMDQFEHLQRFRNNVILGQITKALADIEEESKR